LALPQTIAFTMHKSCVDTSASWRESAAICLIDFLPPWKQSKVALQKSTLGSAARRGALIAKIAQCKYQQLQDLPYRNHPSDSDGTSK
jgi:hypothetical protein